MFNVRSPTPPTPPPYHSTPHTSRKAVQHQESCSAFEKNLLMQVAGIKKKLIEVSKKQSTMMNLLQSIAQEKNEDIEMLVRFPLKSVEEALKVEEMLARRRLQEKMLQRPA